MDLKSWTEFGVAGLLAAVLIFFVAALFRWIGPKMIDAGLSEARDTRQVFKDTIVQMQGMFDRTLEAMRVDGAATRQSFERSIDTMRMECKEQREHDDATRQSAWRYMIDHTKAIDAQVSRMEALVERLIDHSERRS